MGASRWDYEGETITPTKPSMKSFLLHPFRKPLNEGELMANSTMLAILGRMVGYSGQTITWEEAMKSEHKLGPAAEDYRWDLVWAVPPVAVPGVTKVV
jgi:myo-inositol 2-dehydrogenase / D-chiro-inositol 1-dehydrogenase